MWIKTLLENMDRIIHGGKHYPVINGIADVPKEVRDDIVGQTHFEDVTHAIDPETVKAVQEANKAAEKAAEAPKDLPEVNTTEDAEKEPEKDPEAAEEVSEASEAEEVTKTKKTTKTK